MNSHRGHAFVAHGSLTSLACDDVLVPTDARLELMPHWRPLLGDRVPQSVGDLGISAKKWAEQRCALIPGSGGGGGPRVWLVATGGTGRESLAWYLEPVRTALRLIAARVDEPLRGRSRRLAAVPLIGVGAGGMAGRRGEVIEALLKLLEERTEAGQDVVLTLINQRDHAAAQHQRRQMARSSLDEHAEEVAADLAGRARRGELALFVGAGVSASAGLPLWNGLIRSLLARADVDGSSVEEIMKLDDPRDQATIAAQALETRGASLTAGLREVLFCRRYGLSHALLAALPVNEVVTTNYDALFERARDDQGARPAVLPFEVPSPRWLLKLHGDLARDASIVLTREDYLKFGNSGGALAGVVQQMLLTKHLLFAGFSFTDENFFRLAHGARRALEDAGWEKPRLVGTALELQGSPMRRRLWKGELNYLAMGDEATPVADAARDLEIFLDRVACLTSEDASFFMDPDYASLREDADEELVDALRAVAKVAREGDGPGRIPVRELLERLGHPLESIALGASPLDLLAPSPPQDDVSSSRAHYPVTLLDLIHAGHLEAGEELVWERPRRREAFRCVVTQSGHLELPHGEIASTLSAAAMIVTGGGSFDGWIVWVSAVRRQALWKIRRTFLAGQATARRARDGHDASQGEGPSG